MLLHIVWLSYHRHGPLNFPPSEYDSFCSLNTWKLIMGMEYIIYPILLPVGRKNITLLPWIQKDFSGNSSRISNWFWEDSWGVRGGVWSSTCCIPLWGRWFFKGIQAFCFLFQFYIFPNIFDKQAGEIFIHKGTCTILCITTPNRLNHKTNSYLLDIIRMSCSINVFILSSLSINKKMFSL